MNGNSKPTGKKAGFHRPSDEEMRKVFEQFDANKDGVISSDELRRFMDQLGFHLSQEDMQILLKAVDDDCNGTVDFQEFYSLYTSITGGDDAKENGAEPEMDDEEALRHAFKVFDKDGDGYINVTELQSVLTSLGIEEGRSIRNCERMIKSVDVDGNGKVDFKEFKKLMSFGPI